MELRNQRWSYINTRESLSLETPSVDFKTPSVVFESPSLDLYSDSDTLSYRMLQNLIKHAYTVYLPCLFTLFIYPVYLPCLVFIYLYLPCFT